MSSRATMLAILLATSLALSGCLTLSTHANPETVADKGTTVYARLTQDGKPWASRNVAFAVIEGDECGDIGASAQTNGKGMASVTFAPKPDVQNCAVTIAVTAEGKTKKVYLRVRPQPLASVRIDGVSAVALILIASFAVDRIVRVMLFLLAFWPPWSARITDPDEPDASAAAKRGYRLAYLALSALLSTVVLAWYGGVRIFSALGFVGINPLLDALVTGLIVVGGAERTESILKGVGGGGGESSSTAPVHVTGTVVMTDRKQETAASAAAQ
jgi:hypothetical protein